MSTLLKLARWAHALRLEHAPPVVQRRLRLQAASTLGAAAAGARSGETAPALRVARGMGSGPHCVAPGVEGLSLHGALFAGSTLSMAHDFDDWMLCAHAGHSAVWAAWLGAAERGLSWERALTMQLAANEVLARLGGFCLAGRQNGQAWSYLHSVGGALIGGMVRGLPPQKLAEAMGLALAQAHHVDWRLFGTSGKLLTAARPLLDGWRLAELVEAGIEGPLGLLDGDSDFVQVFANGRPLRGWLTGLSAEDPSATAWLTHTLAIKTVPGCAYLSTAVQALEELRLDLQRYEQRALVPDEILRVDVDAGLLTMAMERLLGAEGPLRPVAVTFSVRLSLAVLVLAGELGPEQLDVAWLEEHEDAVRALADRIHLHHDWRLTLDTWGALRDSVGADRLLAGIGPVPLLAAAGKAGGFQTGMALTELPLALAGERLHDFDSDELPAMLSKGLSRLSGFASRGMERIFSGVAAPRKRPYDLSDHDLSAVQVPMPARVRVLFHGGQVRESEVTIARGAPGGAPAEAALRDKLLRWRLAADPAHRAEHERLADALLGTLALPGDGPAAVLGG